MPLLLVRYYQLTLIANLRGGGVSLPERLCVESFVSAAAAVVVAFCCCWYLSKDSVVGA